MAISLRVSPWTGGADIGENCLASVIISACTETSKIFAENRQKPHRNPAQLRTTWGGLSKHEAKASCGQALVLVLFTGYLIRAAARVSPLHQQTFAARCPSVTSSKISKTQQSLVRFAFLPIADCASPPPHLCPRWCSRSDAGSPGN